MAGPGVVGRLVAVNNTYDHGQIAIPPRYEMMAQSDGERAWVQSISFAASDQRPPCIANDDRISTNAFMMPQVRGIQVDILKKPAV